MHDLYSYLWALLPWAVFLGLILFAKLLVTWARKRRSGAVAFGVLVQMFLPDPKVQQTIEVVQKQKSEIKKQQDGQGQDKDEPPSV